MMEEKLVCLYICFTAERRFQCQDSNQLQHSNSAQRSGSSAYVGDRTCERSSSVRRLVLVSLRCALLLCCNWLLSWHWNRLSAVKQMHSHINFFFHHILVLFYKTKFTTLSLYS